MNTTRLSSALLFACVLLAATAVAPARAVSQSPSTGPSTRPAATPGGPAAVIRLSGTIDDYNRDQLFLRFEKARAAGAKTIILEIDTYGGLVGAGLDISRFLKNQNDLYVIAFVNSKAISAGAMIALACNEIIMTASGTLGDCAPIQVAPDGGGVRPMEKTERSKAESPILADFDESAKRNGHDRLLAAAMVSIPYTVHWVEDAQGNRRFANAEEYKVLREVGWKPVAGEPDPIDGDSTLLTVHTQQALKFGLAKGTAATADELAAGRGLSIVARYQSGVGDYIVSLLGSDIIRGFLFIIFLNALFLSLKTPGHGGPEAVALFSLGLMVGVPLLTGYAVWWEVALILCGIGLIVFEIFVFPGHLVSLIAGTLMLIAGLLLTFVGDFWSIPGGWNLAETRGAIERGLYVLVIGLALGIVAFNYLWKLMPKLPYFRRLMLAEAPAGAGSAVAPGIIGVSDDAWPFIGTTGVALSDLKPGGVARFPYAADVRETSVVSESGYVTAGTKIIVREVHGNRVVVRTLV